MSSPNSSETLPILATAVTPWTAEWRFDAEAFARQVRSIARELTRRIYIFGTAGEGHAVSDTQFREIASCFLGVAREESVTPMIGVISMSLPTGIERIAWAREQGCREFQISLPSWGALNDRELDVFFAETCGRFADCRFLHYNLQRTGRLLTAADYRRLADAHPNFLWVKSSASDPAIVRDFMALRPRLRFFFTERGYTEARRHGECGYLISIGSVHPAVAHRFVAADDAERARLFAGIQAMGAKLRELAAGRFHIDSAFDKVLYKVSDPAFPLRLLPPYQGAAEEDFAAFLAAIPPEWRR
ncbi:MAG: dihydrodipicolinate synthase family protein [Opitutaceae bacterium]|nr:dihydrodipicolinate synthase family protein [Opitutaceae bacterium]